VTVKATDAGQYKFTGEAAVAFRLNAPPVAEAGADASVDEGTTTFAFDGGGSTDDLGANGIYLYSWTLPGGLTKTGKVIEYPTPQDGVFTAVLTVTDIAGAKSSDTVQLTVNNVPPSITPAGDVASDADGVVHVAKKITDPGVLDVVTAWINWGDGKSESVSVSGGGGTGAIATSHAYAANGIYAVTLKAFDGAATTTMNFNANVEFQSAVPTISGTAGGVEGMKGAYLLDSNNSKATTWTVDWDDGPTETYSVPGGSTLQVYHTFADGTRTYNVSAEVTDGATAVTTNVFPVLVVNAAPAVVPAKSAYTADEGSPVTVEALVTDAGTLDKHTAWIWWGDGTASSAQVTYDAAGGHVAAAHAYADNGTYTVVIRATETGADAAWGEGSATVTVNNVAPVVTPAGPQVLVAEPTSGGIIQIGKLAKVVGTFTDPGYSFAPVGEETFTASIDWGDGSPTGANE